MFKLQRNERVAGMMNILTTSPGKIFPLGTFAEMFGCAKSTISEDIDIIQSAVKKLELGIIETLAGASGGVKFLPIIGGGRIKPLLDSLSEELSKKERLLPGGYLYTLDVIYNPEMVSTIASIFTKQFLSLGVDYVITVETKGIPLAYNTAVYLNVPLVIVRHDNEATDGASVNINYVSGSSSRLQTMVLSLKALKRNSKLLFIDDFMKGGGTAKGIIELGREFACEVAGIGVFIETVQPVRKLVDNYFSILTLKNVHDEEGVIDIKPSTDVSLLLKELKNS
jgi:purine operon repressor